MHGSARVGSASTVLPCKVLDDAEEETENNGVCTNGPAAIHELRHVGVVRIQNRQNSQKHIYCLIIYQIPIVHILYTLYILYILYILHILYIFYLSGGPPRSVNGAERR